MFLKDEVEGSLTDVGYHKAATGKAEKAPLELLQKKKKNLSFFKCNFKRIADLLCLCPNNLILTSAVWLSSGDVTAGYRAKLLQKQETETSGPEVELL